MNGPKPGEIILQFGKGATRATVTEIGYQYGLNLIGGPLISGAWAPGKYMFETAQAVIQPQSPTTALVFFPSFTKHSDRMAFLSSNNLRFLRWLRSDDDAYTLALVKLPPADLHPVLIDSQLGRFQITLPQDLTVESVAQWSVQNGLTLLNYAPDSGIAIVHPNSWTPPVEPPVWIAPVYTRPASPPAPPNLYVQFATSLGSAEITSIAQGLGLGVANITPGDLATLRVDPEKVNAEIQLLSDLASVQCVNTSPNPCPVSATQAPATTAGPTIQPLSQPGSLIARVVGGVLELDWPAAAGATAYAIFRSSTSNGPFAQVAIVAGGQRTSFQAFDLAALGTTTYYQVLALHPCLGAGAPTYCDATAIAYTSGSGPWVAWTNVLPAAPASPSPTPAPSAAPTASPSATPSPVSAASPDVAPPAVAPPAAAPPAAAPPAVAPPAAAPAPAQTQTATPPLTAPGSLTAAATDGHVNLSWPAIAGASSYRVYRSAAGGGAMYIGATSQTAFTDVGGTAGTAYEYWIAGVAESGLVGAVSAAASVVWQPATQTPSVLRTLPVQADPLGGRVRLQVDVTSGTGTGSVQWSVGGPATSMTLGPVQGQPNAQSPLSWSAAINWETDTLLDGTYTVTATVIDAGGPQITITDRYRIQNGAPPAPTSLTAISQSGGVALAWQQPSAASSTTYRIFRDHPVTGAPLAELPIDSRSYIDSRAAAGQHVYQLVLVDAAGHQSPAAAATVTVGPIAAPPAPVRPNLNLMLPNGQPLAPGGRVTDRLVAVTPAQEGIKFQLSRDGSTWSDVGQLPRCGQVCALDYDLGGLAPGAYQLRVESDGQEGAAHSFVRGQAVRYAPPMELKATGGPLGVQLSWTSPSTALPSFFMIERRSANGEWQVVDRVAAASYIDSSAPGGVEVMYRVSAVDGEGTAGNASAPTSVTLPTSELASQERLVRLTAPTGLRVMSSAGRAVLEWQPVAGSTGYEIERQSQPGGPFAVVGTTPGETFAESLALSAAEYTYRVEALNSTVTGVPSSEASALIVPLTAPPPVVTFASNMATAPPTPTALTATPTTGQVRLTWTAPSGTAPTTTYSVYRVATQSGVFTQAATGLETTSFVDSGLSGGASYGYVVTAAAPGGAESTFSSPTWASVAMQGPSVTLDLVGSVTPRSAFIQPEGLLALAQVTGGAGLAEVSFAISPAGGSWRSIPTTPIDPRSPSLPSPVIAAGGASLWASTISTTALAPGPYQVRVQIRDQAGSMQSQIRELLVAGDGARGPPSLTLKASALPGAVHLEWSGASATGFLVRRSLFGPLGPFDTIASVQANHFDDVLAVPNQDYAYQIVTVSSSIDSSPVASASPRIGAPAPIGNGPRVSLGPVGLSELSATVSPVTVAHQLQPGLEVLGGYYSIDAASRATGLLVHHLSEPAQLSFALPPGLAVNTAAQVAIYHWEDAQATWVQERSAVDPSMTTVLAIINHLSQFVVGFAAAAVPGVIAQPPAPPTDPNGSHSNNPRLTPPPAQPLQVAADGEVVSLRTANGRVYKKADGTLQQTITATPVNYLDSAGAWQKIDSTLVANSGSSGVHNAANSFHVDLPGSFNERAISVGDGSSLISMSLAGAGSAPQTVSGDHATYAGVMPGIDASYQVKSNSLKENLVINSRPTQNLVFTFDLWTGGLILQRQPDGTVAAVDGGGQIHYTIAAPWMYDAAITQTDRGTMSRNVAVTLTGGSGSYVLTYAPDASWLNDPARRYPVMFDPTLTAYSGNGEEYDDQINSYAPDFNYHGYTYLPIGYTYYSSPCCASAPSRAEIQFTGFLGEGYWASSATFYMYQETNYGYQRGNCCTLYYVTAPTVGWSYTGVTWNNQPGVTGAYSSAYASSSAGVWIGWGVTSLVQAWENHSLANNGVMVYTPSENGPYNTNETFSGGLGPGSPELVINFDNYWYAQAVALPTNNVLPSGGTTPIDVGLTNTGSPTWGTDTRISYRWWSGGVQQTSYSTFIYMPYSVPSGTTVDLRFNVSVPALAAGTTVYLQFGMFNNTFTTSFGGFNQLHWGPQNYSCDQFYYNNPTPSCSTGTAITLQNESATLGWQASSQVISAVASSLITIPLTLTNTSTTAGANFTWHAYDAADIVRVGIRDYRSASGSITPLATPNVKTYLSTDVAPGGTANLNAVFLAPGDPGDYLLRLDLVHDTAAATTWFADQGNQPLEVRARIVAPGDDKTTNVPVSLGDGSSLGVNTSNGFASLSATDITIAERGNASLEVSRTYNGVNGLLSSAGTSATSATYGLGWTFSFQRSLHLGSLGANTYDPATGTLTDAQGRAWILTWNYARGLYEDAAGNRTVTPTSAQVTTSGSAITVPGLRPVDLLNGAGAITADTGAPGGYALKFEGTTVPPTALVMPSGLVPVQQNGTIEFWFRPNFDMTVTTSGCHVFFSDGQMQFGLAWNCTTQRWGNTLPGAIEFFTLDADTNTYNVLATATAVSWANQSWHHISITWAESGAKQLVTDLNVVSNASHAQSPIGDLVFGYEADGVGSTLNFLNGRITQLRIDGRVVPGTVQTQVLTGGELWTDAQTNATVAATANTLYLGHYDAASAQSAAGTYTIRNADQSSETYSPTGVLLNQADRFGNQIDYNFDSSGRISSISDHSISGRSITFAYNAGSFTATDLGSRTVTYSLNANGDLTLVTKSNQIPDPRTGVVTSQNATTSYTYASGHLLQQATDPRGARTTVNYDQSYRQVVLIDNPTAYWRLGEVSGTAAVDAIGNYPATQHGGVTVGQGGSLWGDPNLAYKFDGTTGYVSTSTSLTGISTTLTLEAWVNHGGVAWSTSHEMIIDLRGGNTYLSVYAGTIFVSVYDGTNQRTLQGGSVPTAGWHHLVGTWDGSLLRVYIDGTISATSSAYAEGVLEPTGATFLGTSNGAAYYLKGTMDEAAVYAGVLYASRIQAHFIAGRLGVAASPSGYAAQVVSDGPVGFWRLAESGTATAVDQSGYTNHGTYVSNSTLGQPGPLTADAATSTMFDGSTSYVLLPTTSIAGSITAEAWVYASTYNQSGFIVSKTPVNQNWELFVYNNTIYWRTGGVNCGASGYTDLTTPAPTVNMWHHIVATASGASGQIFIDGALVATSSSMAAIGNSTYPIEIGRYGAYGGCSGGYYFSGSIANVAIYNSALTSGRILAHYAAGKSAPLSGSPYPAAVLNDKPFGYWRLGETTGTNAADSSGSGNGGTYQGTVSLGRPGALPTDPGYAATFNGTNSYVLLPTYSVSAAVTVEAWINAATYNQSGFIVSKTPVNQNWELFVYNNTIYWRTGGVNCGTAGSYSDLTTPAPSVNTWHHIVAVANGTAGQIFIDGSLVASSSSMIAIGNGTYPIEIGRFGAYGGCSGGYYFTGSIAEVATYAAALSPARILAHYRASQLAPIPSTGSSIGGYSTQVLAGVPAGYWRLGETGGQATDGSGNNHPSTVANAITYSVGGAIAADADTAMGFNGTSSYLSIPYTSPLAPSPAISLEVWFKAAALPSSAPAILLDTENGTFAKGAKVAFDTAGHAAFQIDPGSVVSSGVLSLNTWHHVVGSYDGTYQRLYVDGALVAGPSAATYVANDGGNITVGAITNGSSNFFNGTIDEPAIYNYALAPARVTAHFMAATDLSMRRVYSVQDAIGTTVASIAYNDDLAITQVINARGLPAYYTFQQYGGRTLSVTDTANDTTRYEYDGGAAYRLMATVSPTGIRQSKFMNSGAPVGQQSQTLMSDSSSQPSSVTQLFMSGGPPNPYVYGTPTLAGTNESWVWDSALTVQPGVDSHRSTPGVSGAHHHDVSFSTGIFIPAGTQIVQWVYIEPGVQLPGNLALQLIATDGTSHRAFWGSFNLLGGACPSACYAGPLPTPGRWVQLTAPLGPAEGASSQVDLDMANRTINQIQFTVVGGTGSVWWGPTSFKLPGSSVTDATRAVSRYAFNATNDQIASVDPNGIAQISDIDAGGLTRASSTGVEPPPVNLLTDPVNTLSTSAWQQEFGYAGTSTAAVTTPQHNGVGSINQTQTGAGLQSDLYKDVTGLSPGTYVQVSVWVQTQAGASGGGGASLAVENHLAAPNNVMRRSASVQSPGQWVQLTLPYIVDGAGQIRIHLWQENFQGVTTWADLRLDDIAPAPDVTLQHPLAVYTSSFEIADAAWTMGSATTLNDATQAHTGLNSIKDTIANNNTSNTVSRTLSISTSATYRVTVWARTAQSGGGGGTGGAVLCAQFSGSTCAPALKTEGQWQQPSTVTVAGSGTLTIQLTHQNFQGTVYWDDVNVERVADQTPATTGSWRGTGWTGSLITTNGAAATWASSWTGGVGGGPSHQVNITAPGLTNDITDTFTSQPLRNGAVYIFSLWATSTTATSITITSAAGLNLTCTSLTTTPTLCQGMFAYVGTDKTSASIVIAYGGQGVRNLAISHPLISLQSQLYSYTAYGQVSLSHDVFGHSTATTYDANSLYPTQTVITATPSPNLTTNDQYNSLGQLLLSTRVNGSQSITNQTWVDSWGRQVGTVLNCVPAAAPPSLCTGAADAATNVMTRAAFDLNGNLVDQYTQGQVAGTWIDTHYVYNANNKRIAEMQNCVTTTNPCDGASNASQNVVNAFAYDQLNNLVDTFTPLPGCTGACVPIPTCSTGPPLTCAAPAIPCPASCADAHVVYDLAGRVYQQIANYNGAGNASQANVTTTYLYDADGRVIDTLSPITSATLQTGQIDENKVYDGIGRMVADIKAYAIPSWMPATTPARTDYTLDAGGRTIAVTAPGTGSVSASNRIVTTTDFSALGKPLIVTADANGLQAVTRSVYDTANNAIHTWTPTTQKLGSTGLETTTVHDLNGQITSVVKDDIAGGLRLTTTTTYDGFGRPTDVVDPRGIDTRTAYDAVDRPISVTSNYCPSGNTNPNCSGSGILPDQNLTTRYVYDLAGNKTQVTNARGIIEFTAYDALGRATFITQDCTSVPAPGGTSCGTQTSDQNVLTSKAYDQTGAVLTSTDALSRVNVFAYDALGRKVSETDDCVGTGGQCNGGVTSGQNLVSGWQVDATGDVLLQLSPRSCTTSAPCYQGGTGLTATDGNLLATGYAYDGLLRLVSVTEDQSTASGHYTNPTLTTSYTYDPSGHKLTMKNGLLHTTTYGLDNLGRVISVQDPLLNTVQTTYSLAGEVTSTINARTKTNANTLDDVGRVVGVTYLRADNTTTAVQSFGYDADGNKTCFSDATNCTGNLTTTTYDHLNRVSTVTSPAPLGTTSYAYFLDGAEQSVTDPTGTTTFTEDGLGRSASMADPVNPRGSMPTTYAYDAAGRLTSRAESYQPPATISKVSASAAAIVSVTSTSVQTQWQADELRSAGDLLLASGSSYNGSSLTIGAGWSLVRQVTQGKLTLALWYAIATGGDAAPTITSSGAAEVQGSVSEWTGNDPSAPLQTNTVAANSANSGNSITLTMAAAPASVRGLSFATYAAHLGTTATVTETPSGSWTQENVRTTSDSEHLGRDYHLNPSTASADSDSPTYTSSGTVKAIAGIIAFFKAGSWGTSNGVVTTASYTGADQVASKTEVSGSTTIASWSGVTYDLAQNRTAETLTYYAGNPYPDPQSGTSTYQYDTVDQLSQANLPGKSAANFGYDAAHNLTANAGVAQTYNTNESLQTACGVTIGAPDADGNQLKDCAGNALSWNSLSQLEKFSTSETYTNDAIGRLTKVANGSTATQFVYRGLSSQVVQELDVNGTLIRSYAWDSSGRQLYVKTGGNVYYEITDLHGDVVALATATGVAGTEHFDPWGNLVASAGTTIAFGYQGSDGSWTDATTGFVHMGARWFYPRDGLFLSSDPAAGTADPRTPMGALRWMYGLGNPVIHSDPNGLRIIEDGGWGDYSGPSTPSPVEPTVYSPPPQPKPPAPCDFWCHLHNGWNAATQIVNVRPDPGGVQDNLIALGNHMDSGWKERYRDTLASSGDWVNGTRSDLTSGDPYRIARGTVGVVMFASNFVPGAGEGVALAEDVGKVGVTELVEHSPQLEHAVSEALPQAERFVADHVPQVEKAVSEHVTEVEDTVREGTDSAISKAEDLPSQIHHYATNKSKQFTGQMQKIADQYGLKLDEAWNKEALPHLGRHPNDYHEWVVQGMQQAADEAGNSKEVFLGLFEKYVKGPVRANPGMLRKAWWL